MGNKRFSMTTYVLVGISLVALYFVGKTVTPPPLTPPVELTPAVAQKVAAESKAKQELAEKKSEAEHKAHEAQYKAHQANTKANPAANLKAFNPNAIDTEATFWHDPKVTDGSTGEKIMAERVKEAKAKMPAQSDTPKLQKAAKTDQQR